jgi:hypothetical protein
MKKSSQTEERKKVQIRATLKMNLKYPNKLRTRQKTHYLVRVGKLIKTPCVECGEVKVQAHHTSYDDPYAVVWLCGMHHRFLEGRQKYNL